MRNLFSIFSPEKKLSAKWLVLLTPIFLLPEIVLAGTLGAGGGTGGVEFQPLHTWILAAATGYLGRSIAIAGGVIGLSLGAARGMALPAIIGVVLAIFGVLGPVIVDTLFTTAII